MRVAGIVLAAGAGTRFGGPKALARTAEGTPWLRLAVDALAAGGCREVVVVLGHGAERARALLPVGATAVVAERAAEGMAESLRAGLRAVWPDTRGTVADAAVVTPVDTPDMPAAAVARLIAATRERPRAALLRAMYEGRPGHPVLIGAAHKQALTASLAGDTGAGPYLRAHGASPIDCSDLWHGRDIDRPG